MDLAPGRTPERAGEVKQVGLPVVHGFFHGQVEQPSPLVHGSSETALPRENALADPRGTRIAHPESVEGCKLLGSLAHRAAWLGSRT
jgi:hypothetical protein